MAREKSVKTCKLQLTVDEATDRIVGDMVKIGIHGASKSEVAAWIIRHWLWANQEALRSNGIYFTDTKK